MANETKHANIRRHSDNVLLYAVTTSVDTALYPRTTNGKAGFKAAVKTGEFTLTVDNGAIIPQGTVPPLVKPAAPGGGSIPALNLHLQAEDASGTNIGQPGQTGDGHARGPIGQSGSSNPLSFTATNPNSVTIAGVTLKLRYVTNTEDNGVGQYRVNGGAWVDIALDGASGGNRYPTLSTTLALNAGANTIDFRWLSGTVYFIDYIDVTRPAS